MEGSEGFRLGFSSCAAPNYLLSRARVFQIVYGSSEVNLEWSVAFEEIERRVQIEARVYSGSTESEFGDTEWSSRE